MSYGLLAQFKTPEELLKATDQTRLHGFTCFDAYTPFPIEGLDDAVGFPRNRVGLAALVGAILGGGTGFGMQWYANVVDYPLNVAGKPYFSWPAFIPVTFELTVLFSALFGAIGMLAMNRLPKLYHPLFAVEEFSRASKDRFFICIQSADPQFDGEGTRHFLSSLDPEAIKEVPDDEER
jgi:hypothetical protein